MFRHSSNRHQRSKVLKLKHALQICALVAVCVWLLYQVKHSHDKKELEIISTSINSESNHMIFGLGRKVLPDVHVVTDAGNDNREDKVIEDVEEDEHEEKKEDGEEESRGSEDDDTDENDREEGEEGRQDEEVEDEEENEVKMDKKALSGSTNTDEEDEKSTQEAREEQYKGDDASSAVVRESEEENHVVGDGNEELEHGVEVNGDEISGEDESHKADESGDGVEVNGDEISGEDESHKADEPGDDAQKVDDSSSMQKEHDAHLSNNTSFNETHPAEDTNLRDGSLLNSTIPELSEKIEQPFNSSLETASNHRVNGDEKFTLENSTFEIVPNDTVHFSQNISTTVLEMVSDNLPSENETVSVVVDGGQNSTATTETLVDDKLPESGDDGSATPVDPVTEPKEKTGNAIDTTGGSEEASHDSSSTGDAGESAHDDSGESAKVDAITEEEKDARTDLSTLAEMQLEGTRSIEEIAAE